MEPHRYLGDYNGTAGSPVDREFLSRGGGVTKWDDKYGGLCSGDDSMTRALRIVLATLACLVPALSCAALAEGCSSDVVDDGGEDRIPRRIVRGRIHGS